MQRAYILEADEQDALSATLATISFWSDVNARGRSVPRDVCKKIVKDIHVRTGLFHKYGYFATDLPKPEEGESSRQDDK